MCMSLIQLFVFQLQIGIFLFQTCAQGVNGIRWLGFPIVSQPFLSIMIDLLLYRQNGEEYLHSNVYNVALSGVKRASLS